MTTAIEAREVFRVYRSEHGDAAALQGLSLRVDSGEIVGVLGPSGAGKSTLLQLVAGLGRPSAGSVHVLGVQPGLLPARRAAAFRARELGLVDQHYARALPPDLTARTIVGLQLALLGAPRTERERRADELLERLGLGDRGGARPAELSGGQQQRVAVAAALAHSPRLVLADEPGGELDRESAEQVYRLLAELARDGGATVLMVSHDPAAADVADRVVQIRDGRLSDEARRHGATAIVVGRGGWLRVPEELLRQAGIGERALAQAEGGAVVLKPTGETLGEATVVAPTSSGRTGAGAAAELRGVSMAYGAGVTRRTVFEGFDLTLEAARLTAVTGRSGTGKSTLLRLLCGLERPAAGDVWVAGESLGGRSREELADVRRRLVAIVPQEPGLVSFLSSIENVVLALSLRGIAADEADRRGRVWLVRMGLEHRLEHRVARLSAGERQRVALARALAAEPALVLLDEPTSRLDQQNAALVGRLLREAVDEHGATVVCATHEPELERQAHRVVAVEQVAPRS